MEDTDKVVVVVRGIPASGKTTWVTQQIEGYEPGQAVRINNDDLSTMLFGAPFINHSKRVGKILHRLRVDMLRTFLEMENGPTDIYIDNTNLINEVVSKYEQVAAEYGARFVVVDHFLSATPEEAIMRDAFRDSPVGRDVILNMYRTARKLKPWVYKEYSRVEKYDNDPSLPHIYIVDIDGTVAHKHPERDIHDLSKVRLDTPNVGVVRAVRALRQMDNTVILMTGRSEDSRKETQRWVEDHVGYGIPLYMRKSKDFRPDHVVKHEMFQENIAGKYHVVGVFEDRNQMIRLWRDRLQIPAFQVANGDF